APAGITGSPRPSADIRESVDRSSLRWHARQGRERTGPPGPGGPTRRPPHTPLGRASMTMTRRTLAVLTAGAVPALGLAAAAQAAPPGGSGGGDGGSPGPTSAEAALALSRVRASADVLMADYDQEKAWFPSSWWNSAVALQTI